MKKRILSLLILSIYFFGGSGMVFWTTFDPLPEWTPKAPDALESLEAEGFGKKDYDNAPDTIQQRGADGTIEQPKIWGSNDMTSTDFSLNPNDLSPSEKRYTGGTKANFKDILANIGKYLLIATTTIAVLSIVVGGLMISTTGPTDRAAKGKTIIMLNMAAVVVALFSYSIIRLVSWIIA